MTGVINAKNSKKPDIDEMSEKNTKITFFYVFILFSRVVSISGMFIAGQITLKYSLYDIDYII